MNKLPNNLFDPANLTLAPGCLKPAVDLAGAIAIEQGRRPKMVHGRKQELASGDT